MKSPAKKRIDSQNESGKEKGKKKKKSRRIGEVRKDRHLMSTIYCKGFNLYRSRQ
jgi:hypothetical protein